MTPHARVGHHRHAAIPNLVLYTILYERAGHMPAFRVWSQVAAAAALPSGCKT